MAVTSIQNFPPPARVENFVANSFSNFQVAVSESFLPLQVTSDRPNRFKGRIRTSIVDDIHVSEVSAARHTVERTPELIAGDERAYYKLSLQLAGTGLLVQDDREALLGPGDLAVYDTSRPYSLVFDDDFRTMVVMFPRDRIELPASVVGQLTAVHMSGQHGTAGMIVPFLSQLVGNLEQLSGSTGARLAHGALDLLTTLFAAELDLKAGEVNPNQILMQKIRGFIDANLASRDLDPSTIAAAHYISTRHLHGLFSAEGTTVSSWIRQRRLERCRRDLIDPIHADRSVSMIAARWGFTDAAHFSRVFRAAFGQSPSELKAGRRAA